jgi:predicted transcriptional regulator
MATETTKDRVLDAVQQLPADATVEQAMERLYFIAKVEEGLRQANAGKLVSHEDVKRRLLG